MYDPEYHLMPSAEHSIDWNARASCVKQRINWDITVRYEYVRPAGAGAYGVVAIFVDNLESRRQGKTVEVAIKRVEGIFHHPTNAKRLLREAKLLYSFHHNNIINLVDLIPPRSYAQFTDLYLVYPALDTNMDNILKKSPTPLTTNHIRFFFYQILLGVHEIHRAGVMHRDLKPENILVNGADCTVKVCDLGLARQGNADSSEQVATRWYRAPELILDSSRYTSSVDIWSLGCILFELFARRALFRGASNGQYMLVMMMEALGHPTDGDLEALPITDSSRKALRQVMEESRLQKQQRRSKSPSTRHISPLSSFSSIASASSSSSSASASNLTLPNLEDSNGQPLHSAEDIAAATDLLHSMLRWNPSQRVTALQCLKHPFLAPYYNPSQVNEESVPFPDDEVDSVGNEVVLLKDMMYEFIREKYHNEMDPSSSSPPSSSRNSSSASSPTSFASAQSALQCSSSSFAPVPDAPIPQPAVPAMPLPQQFQMPSSFPAPSFVSGMPSSSSASSSSFSSVHSLPSSAPSSASSSFSSLSPSLFQSHSFTSESLSSFQPAPMPPSFTYGMHPQPQFLGFGAVAPQVPLSPSQLHQPLRSETIAIPFGFAAASSSATSPEWPIQQIGSPSSAMSDSMDLSTSLDG